MKRGPHLRPCSTPRLVVMLDTGTWPSGPLGLHANRNITCQHERCYLLCLMTSILVLSRGARPGMMVLQLVTIRSHISARTNRVVWSFCRIDFAHQCRAAIIPEEPRQQSLHLGQLHYYWSVLL